MAFLPFFQTRAASEFSTPLTEMSFIEQLYQSNYIQYKYLKEKDRSEKLVLFDLYLTIDYLGSQVNQVILNFLPLQPLIRLLAESLPTLRLTPPFLTVIWKEALYNVFLSQIDEMKAGAEKLTQYVDYCAQDTASGTQIGNSSVSELTALLNGQTSTEHPSLYLLCSYRI